ncbi:MAG: hypothetical protein AAF844_00220 [Pseudomonadota bacterium]
MTCWHCGDHLTSYFRSVPTEAVPHCEFEASASGTPIDTAAILRALGRSWLALSGALTSEIFD